MFNNTIEVTIGAERYRFGQLDNGKWIVQHRQGSWWADLGPSEVKVELWDRNNRNIAAFLAAA